MKSPYLSELQPNQTVQGTFLVSYKDVRQKKSGEPYLSLTLTDRSGDLDAKMWDNAAEALSTFERDDFVRIKGLLQIFQNRPQLTLHKIQPVPESEIDLADYLPASKRDRDEMFREVQAWIAGMSQPHLKQLLEEVFADQEIAVAFRTAPAAKTVHHNWIGGLIEHVLSLCQLAKFSAQHYPHIDFDLLLTGVLLHDIGKIRELHYARSFGYTTEGQLLGHIQIGVQMVLDKLRQFPDFPPRLRDLVVHMILSHHGELEYGSPKIPLFPEALLLHHLDNMDSKTESMRALIDRDKQVTGVWTSYSSPLDRAALKKSKYLDDSPAPAVETPPAKQNPPVVDPNSGFGAKLRDALGGKILRRPAAKHDLPPPLELACLRALWPLGEGTVHDVRRALSKERVLAYTTVMTLLDRLEKRGCVARRKPGRSFLYRPKISRDAMRDRALKQLLGGFFDGSPDALLAYLRQPRAPAAKHATPVK